MSGICAPFELKKLYGVLHITANRDPFLRCEAAEEFSGYLPQKGFRKLTILPETLFGHFEIIRAYALRVKSNDGSSREGFFSS
jgi:hypothetical protein